MSKGSHSWPLSVLSRLDGSFPPLRLRKNEKDGGLEGEEGQRKGEYRVTGKMGLGLGVAQENVLARIIDLC